ncbi:MAG: hypothetical protein METHP_00260 [Methanoregula sp. SKADARSKE-2]|nr:MAG: hypothetical protein METHP_00260 [Methanoregula sp. SKADARSKE-2]
MQGASPGICSLPRREDIVTGFFPSVEVRFLLTSATICGTIDLVRAGPGIVCVRERRNRVSWPGSGRGEKGHLDLCKRISVLPGRIGRKAPRYIR